MRKDRVASVLAREISLILEHELKDPRVDFLTVTSVDVSPDLKQARVYFSSLGDKAKDHEVLQHAKGYIRSLLASRVRLRTIPEIEFMIDNTYEEGTKIDALFKKINKDNPEQ
jgi:ribosome-binding factor A